MIGLPPLLAGAVQSSWAPARLPARGADAGRGAGGVAAGVTAFDFADSGPGPTALIAVTVKV